MYKLTDKQWIDICEIVRGYDSHQGSNHDVAMADIESVLSESGYPNCNCDLSSTGVFRKDKLSKSFLESIKNNEK